MLFGKTEVLKIEKKENAIAWEINLEKGKNYDLKIDNSLQCILYKNGVKAESLYATMDKNIIKNKEGNQKIVAVNRTNKVNVRCGCGDIPFKDYETDIETKVGVNGICYIKVLNPNQFVDLFTDLTLVDNEKVEDYFRKNLAKVLTMALTSGLDKFGKDVEKEKINMGEAINNYLANELVKYGISVEGFDVLGIKFSDEYLAQRQAYFDEKKRKKEERRRKVEEEEEREREVETIIRLNESSAKKEEVKEFVTCSLCGFKNEKGVSFCSKCGNRIK